MLRPLAPLAAIVLLAACVAQPGPRPSPSPSPPAALATADMTAALAAKPLPPADLFDLTRRLRGRDGVPASPFTPVRTSPPDEGVGATAQFWLYDFAAKTNVRRDATLRILGEHAKWWIENGISVDAAALQATATAFDTKIYPADRAAYGAEWSPGIDGDPRISVFIARIPGSAAGYYSSNDEYPVWVNQFSAEREMIYANATSARLGTEGFSRVLAHELCHMIQFNKRVPSAVWFNEGQAQLCERFATSDGGEQLYLLQPDTQLDDWAELDQGARVHYADALLFLEWLQQHAGGDALINALMEKGIETPADIDTVLRARGQRGMDEQFADFAAANALIGASPPDALAYSGLHLTAPATAADRDRLGTSGELKATVHQYATRYVALPQAPVRVEFRASPTTRIIPTEPHSGSWIWWSDRGDAIDTTMTRTVDLRPVAKATLSFWTWYETEKDFDYAYAAVSTDGGKRWATLRTEATTTDDPNGNNLGNGFTGTSGRAQPPVWIPQTADLTPYAGKEIQLRFEYVTDGALNYNSFAVEDIAIPEIGWSDDSGSDNGWTADGFIRSSNVVKQRFVVQVIRFGATPTVERHIVEDGVFDLEVDGSTDRKPPLLAVSGLAPRTTEPVPFTVRTAAR